MQDPSTIYSGLLDRGFAPHQAAALTGNIQQESNFNPAAVNQNEGANGLLQWRLDRWKGLQDFAGSRGTSPSDVNTQLDFIKHEMGGSEAKNAAPFMAAPDLATANSALRKYIRYGDNSEGARLNFASKFANSEPNAPLPAYSWSPNSAASPSVPAGSAPAVAMPAYGWTPNNAPAASPQAQMESPLPQMPGMAPMALTPPDIPQPPRRPPDLRALHAFLQRAPVKAGAYRF